MNNIHPPHVVRIHIDNQHYESPTPTTGAALYKLAHVRAEMHLYKEVHGHTPDVPISNDGAHVELKNGDYFRTGKPEHEGLTIYVNTEPFPWERLQISYDEAVKLAFPNGPFDENVRYSITWTKPDGAEGALLKGHKVKVVNGMQFDVRNTDKS